MVDVIIAMVADRLEGMSLSQPFQKSVNKEDEAVLRKLRNLQTLVADIEMRRVIGSMDAEFVREWLEKLEELAYEIDDILEEWHMKSIQKKRPKVVRSLNLICSRGLKQVLVARSTNYMALKMKKINSKLEAILTEPDNYVMPTDRERPSRPLTTSLIDQSQVYGREHDKDALLNHLIKIEEEGNDYGIPVISIVGPGGIGKTTVAQLFYNDEGVQKYFQLRKWIGVGYSFDERRIFKALLPEYLGSDMLSLRESDLEFLLLLIRQVYSGKRFLIVFDDVWTENATEWKIFRDSLRDCVPGSMILVTTRSERVATAAGTNHLHSLGPLSNSDCWLILKRMALRDKPQLHKEVHKIGHKIAKQCRGLPLLAKIVGDLLRFKHTKQEWKEAFEMWQTEQVVKDILPPIYRSYQGLPPQLKRCFSYCVVFPRDTRIHVERLVRLWVAEGFTGYGGQSDNESMEKMGYKFFRDLVNRSCFIYLETSIHKNKITSCKVSESLHVLAEYALPDLAFLVQRKKFDSSSVINRRVRSFLILSPSDKVPKDLYERLKHVRALVLSCCQLEELPSEVGNLSLLKYLDLSGNPLRQLPEIICNLILLESLDVHSCYLLLSLPQRIGELQQLKHLRINHTTDELHHLPQGFENLSLIETLDVIRAGGRYKDNIEKLRKLNHLEDIRIVVHGEVRIEDAKLESKIQMENLELCFAGDGLDVEKASSIEKLQPPPGLQMLKFQGYPGLRLPKFIESSVSLINKLRRLSLKSALNISSLPALWKLSSLEFLWLYDLPNLKHLGLEFFGLRKESEDDEDEDEEISDLSEDDDKEIITVQAEVAVAFPKLETLRIENLQNWKIWEDVDEDDEKHMNNKNSVMPCLKELRIHGCPNLESLPHRILGKRPRLRISQTSMH